jgi:hypothetical protein
MLKNRIVKSTSFLIILTLALPTTALAGRTVTKEEWVSGMGDILPAYFCKNGWYYRSCFDISAEECHSVVTEATKSCLRQYSPQIPETLEQPKDGKEWGNKIGTCVGTIIEGASREKRISSEQCDDITKWK